MINKIIAVGTTTQNNRFVNGQSMMFQLLVDSLKTEGIEVRIVDFGKSIYPNYSDKRVSGKFSFVKLIDNFFCTVKYIYLLLINPQTDVYLNTAQSKIGFIRDYVFINLAKWFKRKVIAHQFGANYEHFFSAQPERLKQRIISTLEKATFVVVEGDYTKKQFSFLNNFVTSVVSIPNGLPEKSEVKNIKPKTICQPVTLLYLSNLIEGKGFWDVLDAAHLLNKQKIEIEVIFVGKFLADINDTICQTPDRAEALFFQRIKEYNLKNKVQYFSGLYGEQKAKVFQKANFFILPSYYVNEGQPASVLEAIAYGCVPIVTNYRLIPTMVNDSNGFFVEPKSPEQIASAVFESMNCPSLYHSKSAAAISFFNENFTAEKYVSKILNLLEK